MWWMRRHRPCLLDFSVSTARPSAWCRLSCLWLGFEEGPGPGIMTAGKGRSWEASWRQNGGFRWQIDCGIQRKARNQYQVPLAECVCKCVPSRQLTGLRAHPSPHIQRPPWTSLEGQPVCTWVHGLPSADGHRDHRVGPCLTRVFWHHLTFSMAVTYACWVSQWGSRPHVTEPNPDPSWSSQIYDGSQSDGGKQTHFFQGLELFIDPPTSFDTPSPPYSICLRMWEWIWVSLSELPGDTLGKFSDHSRRPVWSRPSFPQHRQSIVLEGCWSSPSSGHGFHSSSYTWKLCPSLDHGAGGLCVRTPPWWVPGALASPLTLTAVTASQDQVHGCKNTALLLHSAINWAHDTYHFSCLAFAGVAGGGGVALLPVFLVSWNKLSSFHS